MTWLLLVIAVILVGLGVWGGPRQKERRPHPHVNPSPEKPVSVEDAWEIITKPLERRDAIHIPEHRPWYIPGADRRFQRGLLVGLGSGLLVAAVAVSIAPRGGLAEPPVVQAPTQTQPQTQAPAPVVTPPPTQPPTRPANVTFVVDEGDLTPTIAAKLREAGLIADEAAFISRVTELGVDTSLKAGTFIIPTGASVDEVIGALTA